MESYYWPAKICVTCIILEVFWSDLQTCMPCIIIHVYYYNNIIKLSMQFNLLGKA